MTRNADFRAMTIFVFGNLLAKVRKFQKDIVVCSILPKKIEQVEVSFFVNFPLLQLLTAGYEPKRNRTRELFSKN